MTEPTSPVGPRYAIGKAEMQRRTTLARPYSGAQAMFIAQKEYQIARYQEQLFSYHPFSLS